MSILDDVRSYLITAGVVQPIFLSRIQDVNPGATELTIIGLFQYTGVDPIYVPEQNKPKYENPRLQILVRSKDDANAEIVAYQVFDLVSQVTNEVINTHNYQKISPLGSPFMLMRDEEERSIWACNYRIFRETE